MVGLEELDPSNSRGRGPAGGSIPPGRAGAASEEPGPLWPGCPHRELPAPGLRGLRGNGGSGPGPAAPLAVPSRPRGSRPARSRPVSPRSPGTLRPPPSPRAPRDLRAPPPRRDVTAARRPRHVAANGGTGRDPRGCSGPGPAPPGLAPTLPGPTGTPTPPPDPFAFKAFPAERGEFSPLAPAAGVCP